MSESRIARESVTGEKDWGERIRERLCGRLGEIAERDLLIREMKDKNERRILESSRDTI